VPGGRGRGGIGVTDKVDDLWQERGLGRRQKAGAS
jgi:hypothetical protein